MGLRVPELTHPDDRQRDWDLFQGVIRGEAPDYRVEKRYVRKDGTIVWVNVNMTVIRDAAGQPWRTVAAIEDIAERAAALYRSLDNGQKKIADQRLAGTVPALYAAPVCPGDAGRPGGEGGGPGAGGRGGPGGMGRGEPGRF